ncbi:hypothetical protein [Thermomonas sp.]|uniref:hypothetical protein n=1 Tax=Thermomonas sp. TaxID=1971895 RepID=UPI00248A19D5|nr:hypothetical protein [Thermomonas sp.]MDI1253032.1 hypothetical protein [Thermomonas sp.]
MIRISLIAPNIRTHRTKMISALLIDAVDGPIKAQQCCKAAYFRPQIRTLSKSIRSAITAYDSDGGNVIIVNDHHGNTSFLDSISSYSAVASYGCTDYKSVVGSKTAAAAGTNFAAGPHLHRLGLRRHAAAQ